MGDDEELIPPVLDSTVEAPIEIRELVDCDKPALKRAIERVKAAKDPNGPQAHKSHKSFNKHTKGWW